MNKIRINENESKLLKFLDEAELDIFTFNSLWKELKGQISPLQPTLESLVKRGFLSRIEKGKYCRHTFRDEKVIANYLAPDGAIAYWSALNLHGLTNQFPNTVFVQTPKLKRNAVIFGVRYHFVKVKPSKAVCYEVFGYGNHTFRITSIEKTLVDCFDLPAYNGGYVELLFALHKSLISKRLNNQKLIEAVKSVENIAVTKRLGYLIEFLHKDGYATFLKYARTQVNQKYNLLDPNEPQKGKFDIHWRLRLNVSEEDILLMAKQSF
jgi:predicted transcriptional regulator of viral defense system